MQPHFQPVLVLCMHAKSLQSCRTLCDSMDYSLLGSSVHGSLQARILEWVAMPCSRGSSQPRGQTQVSCMPADSFLFEPPGKPKNTGVGILSLLQGIFPTQESNWDLLHCRQILYQLSYQGSHLESRVMLIPRNESCFGAMSMGTGFG